MKKLILVLSCLYVIGFVLFNSEPDAARISINSPVLEQSSEKSSDAPPNLKDELLAVALKNQNPGSLPNWRSLEEQFRKAQSLRAFHYSALKRPADGGYYYAFGALALCKSLAKIVTKNDTEQPRELVELKYRCDFTEQDFEAAERQLEAIRSFKFSDDPLYKLTFDYLAVKDRVQRSTIVEEAITHGHPEVISSLVYPALEETIFRQSGPNKKIPPHFAFVSTLLSCELGADCGPNSTRALELCAHTGWCNGSVRESLNQGLGANFNQLDALVKQTVIDIRNRNFEKLIPSQ